MVFYDCLVFSGGSGVVQITQGKSFSFFFSPPKKRQEDWLVMMM